MSKKTRNLIITAVIAAVVVIGSVTAYHFYRESPKSKMEKAAQKTTSWGENAVDKTGKAAKQAADWTVKTTDKAVEKTKKLFK